MANIKYIETPELMWQYFQEYVKDVKSKPFLVKDWVGKDGDEVYREKEKPLTIEGFDCYLYEKDIINSTGDYFANKNNKYDEFSDICSHIRKVVRADQIAGGMAGIYNPSITQRLNGLVEKTQTEFKVEQPLFLDTNQEQKKIEP